MVTIEGDVGGQRVQRELALGDTVIGRSPNSDFVLSPPSVSRRHARLRVTDDGRCFVTDLGSRCGTYVRGARVEQETELVPGDKLVVGEVSLKISRTGRQEVQFDSRLAAEGTVVRAVGDRLATGPKAALTAERLLKIFADVGRMLLSVRPLPEVLAQVTMLTFDVVPNERAFLLVADKSSPEGFRSAVALMRDGTASDGVTISRTVLNTVVEQRVAMLAMDVASDRRLDGAQSLLDTAIRSFMCAPLVVRDEIVGLLYVDARRHRFTPADLDAFSALADYAALGIEQARLSEQLLAEGRRRERLQRYHSASVIDRIMKAGEEADTQLIAQEREVSVLFCDIVSFTTLCEGMPPNEIVSLLNAFFSKMGDVVFQFEGTLDKFIGDELMVVFNAPLEQPDHALRAARTALGMRTALAEFNRDQPVPLEVRISIASGTAMVGDIGTTRRRDFTVLGDVVNTAARLKAAVAKPGQIVMSGTTQALIGDELETAHLGPVAVRGRIAKVDVYTLNGE